MSIAALLLALLVPLASAETVGDPTVALPDPEGAEQVRTLSGNKQHEEAIEQARAILATTEVLTGTRSLAFAKSADLLVYALWYGGKAAAPETLELAERALTIKQEQLGPRHVELIASLLDVAALLQTAGRHAEARPLYEQRLEMSLAILPPDDPRIAYASTDVANLLTTLGEFDNAKELYERSLAVMEQAAGVDSAKLAPHLYNLGRINRMISDFGAARGYLRRALKIQEASLGPDNPRLTPYLNGLAALQYNMGDYVSARRNHERTLEIRRKSLGPDHPDVAASLNNLALVLRHTGDYAGARKLFEEALEIHEAHLPPNDPTTALSMRNLAVMLDKLGEREEAIKHFDRALEIQLAVYGPEHAAVATTLNNHADLLANAGQYEGARRLYERALAIREKVFEPDHPDLASCLDGLGIVLDRIGTHEEARKSFARALEIREKGLGRTHPFVADVLDHYADLLSRVGDTGEALDLGLRAESISRDHLMLTSRTLPERQALRYADHRAKGLDLALSIAAKQGSPEIVEKTWDALIRSRALVLDEMAARSRSLSLQRDSEIAPYAAELAQASSELANLSLRGPETGDTARFRATLDQARSRKENAERALAERSAAFREELNSRKVGLKEVRAALPEDSALVAYAYYDRGEAPAYLSFVLKSDGQPQLVTLGAAENIDRLVSSWRAEAATGVLTRRAPEAIDSAYRAAGAELREAVWDPLGPFLEGVKRVFVVPDGALQLVSFAALPVGKKNFLVESAQHVHYVSAERDMAAYTAKQSSGKGLLTLGGPDFESAEPAPEVSLRGTRSACGDFTSIRFGKLPASVREATEVAELFGEASLHLSGSEASEAAFKAQAPGRQILHLATHGFFLGDSCPSALGRTRGIGGLTKGPSAPAPVPVESPLVLSGLALAGANRRDEAGPDEEDGILTAEEISAMDLSSVEWAVLSACDTGVGTIKAGEGIFGLRRAFQIAGASTVIMSLWAVEDRSTRSWMRALYDNRLSQGRNTAESVHQASLKMLRQRREEGASTHPFYWAGFVAAGDWR